MEDVVDFFIPKCQVLGIMAEIFGICDDDDKAEKTLAYVSFDNEEKWGAIIKNYSGKPLNFTAVDNWLLFGEKMTIWKTVVMQCYQMQIIWCL